MFSACCQPVLLSWTEFTLLVCSMHVYCDHLVYFPTTLPLPLAPFSVLCELLHFFVLPLMMTTVYSC